MPPNRDKRNAGTVSGVHPVLSRLRRFQSLTSDNDDVERPNKKPKLLEAVDTDPRPIERRTGRSSCCFHIRTCPEKNGIGMYASTNIPCGSLIVAHEDPIVSCVCDQLCEYQNKNTDLLESLYCEGCSTPVSSIERHVDAAQKIIPNEQEELWHEFRTFLFAVDNEVKQVVVGGGTRPSEPSMTFSDPKVSTSCQSSCGATWCSERCYRLNKHFHELLYCEKSKKEQVSRFFSDLESLRDNVEMEDGEEDANDGGSRSMIFRLAMQVVTLTLASILEDRALVAVYGKIPSEPLAPTFPEIPILCNDLESRYFWWREYGSHPLWHEINSLSSSNPTNACLENLNRSRKDATQSFSNLMRSLVFESPRTRKITEIVQKLCSPQCIGEILGMLQTNVMEFSFPSPQQQLMSEFEYFVQDRSQNPDGNPSEIYNVPVVTPVIGSGLYPLLTLANHDCNPNARIEFLRESHCGSMVALRPIEPGEEITITYVPNGDYHEHLESHDPNSYFQHFGSTKTWQWLRRPQCDVESDGEEEQEDDDEDGAVKDKVGAKEPLIDMDNILEETAEADLQSVSGSPSTTDNGEESESNTVKEGCKYTDRAMWLCDYGFECHCSRCQAEKPTQMQLME
jgi:SET domain